MLAASGWPYDSDGLDKLREKMCRVFAVLLSIMSVLWSCRSGAGHWLEVLLVGLSCSSVDVLYAGLLIVLGSTSLDRFGNVDFRGQGALRRVEWFAARPAPEKDPGRADRRAKRTSGSGNGHSSEQVE